MTNDDAEKIKSMLHAWELGLLSEEEQEAFERLLLGNDLLFDEARDIEEAIRLLKTDPDILREIEKVPPAEISKRESNGPEPESRPKRSRYTWVRIAAVAAVLLIIFLLKDWRLEFSSSNEAAARENLLAVMPFENLADKGDLDNLGWILSNLVITDLSESRYVHVVSGQHLYDILKRLGLDKSDPFSRDNAEEISKIANAKWMLLGSVVQTEPNLALTVQLIDVASEDVIKSLRMTAKSHEDMFSLVDRLTVELKKELSLPEAAWSEADPPVAEVTTHSPEAFQAYLDGVECIDKLYYNEAYEYYRKAVEYDSTFAIAYYALSFTGNREMLEKAIQYSSGATRKEQLYIKSREAYMAHDIDSASYFLKKIVDNFPDDKIALFELANISIMQKNYDEAFMLLRETLKYDPLYRMSHNTLVYLFDKIGQYDSALVWADRYVAIAPAEPNPYDTRGEIYARHGKLDDAIESYETAYSIRPDFYEYQSLLTLSRLHIYKGNYDRAIELIREAIKNGDGAVRATARTYLALVPLYRGQFEMSLNILNDGIAADKIDLMEISQASALKHVIKGNILEELGDYGKAEREILEALAIQESLGTDIGVDIKSPLCSIYGSLGDTELMQAMADGIQTETHKSTYRQIMARIEYLNGNTDKAIAWLTELESEDELDFDDSFLLGMVYLKAEQYRGAAWKFESILNDYYNIRRAVFGIKAVKSHYYLALANDNMGNYDKAMQQYEIFSEIWRDADPKPELVDKALERLSELRNRP